MVDRDHFGLGVNIGTSMKKNYLERNMSMRVPPSSYKRAKEQLADGKPVKGRSDRTFSVDTGLSALCTLFYEKKLQSAKNQADKELEDYLAHIKSELE
eukprot:CAMPEP_0177683262 /NCGR_PEP_ID=MMETSP0447-20121125/31697_1 /TAXON_ID=0 /ORGANISM="Stygamoeba regulata, Strain BSH-02190019" /LENGTH=97 /DNA_ID=CAMNT_0019192817 /DNA_START=162 /DNA_END=452 /DNA_ORIENTATION=+